MKYLRIVGVAALLISCFLSAAYADTLTVFTGSRSTSIPGQLATDDGWNDWGGFKLSFNVQLKNDATTGDYWQYTYTFSNANGKPLSPQIEKFLKLQVSSVTGAWYKLENINGPELTPVDDNGFHLWDAPLADPYYDLGYHLKIGGNEGPVTGQLLDGIVTIVSSQAPMWGSFYARGGYTYSTQGPAEAINKGFLDNLRLSTETGPDGQIVYQVIPGGAPVFSFDIANCDDAAYKGWILVPDTKTTVPEGGSTLLFLTIALLPIALSCRLWRS